MDVTKFRPDTHIPKEALAARELPDGTYLFVVLQTYSKGKLYHCRGWDVLNEY
jgi:hypothetical protein